MTKKLNQILVVLFVVSLVASCSTSKASYKKSCMCPSRKVVG